VLNVFTASAVTRRGHQESIIMRIVIASAALLAFFGTAATAEAGCITGAIVGGVAGHMVGHGKVGAAAGCAVGHHNASKNQQQQQQPASK
jgi:outer membrane lipoprotein SlyB